jgi:MFS family permease
MSQPRSVQVLLNVAHGIDHMFLLIFATAVSSMAPQFGFSRWEDLMPYTVGAFVMFGLGSLPAGRLGDLWGRRNMMLVFFFGMAVSAALVSLTQQAWQLALALTLVGVFASIYHPVGIPMLVQGALKPGLTIGINGLAGNLGIAVAALITGFLVAWQGWRAAFLVPAVFALICGVLFWRLCPKEAEPPSKRTSKAAVSLDRAGMIRVVVVMTITAVTSSLLFNLTTNGNAQLMNERMRGLIETPQALGVLLACVYALASVAQVVVGRLIDKYPLKKVYGTVVLLQIPMFIAAVQAHGWMLFFVLIGFMVMVFGAIPFTDAMVVRYVDDRMRSRVAGVRLAVAFGISSAAVWLLGPVVKAQGFGVLLASMAGIAVLTFIAIFFLPSERAQLNNQAG